MLTTAHEAAFADGRYLFDLKLPQLAELQEKRGPIFQVHARVCSGCLFEGSKLIINLGDNGAHAADIFETIRLGLIGGGRGVVNGSEIEVSPLTALNLVERYCHEAPLVQNLQLAATIITGRVTGFVPPKKDEAATEPPAPTASTSRKSSPPAKRSR